MKIGTCHLCAQNKKLSFEHFPPESTGNNSTVRIGGFFDAFRQHPMQKIRGIQSQRGFGNYSLCESCNSYLGSNYTKLYQEWNNFGVQAVENSNNSQFVTCESATFSLLGIFKQVISFFIAGDSNLIKLYPELKDFILDRYSKAFPNELKVFCYITDSQKIKSVSQITAMQIGKPPIKFSEFVSRPFGYLMTFNGEYFDDRLTDITQFSTMEFSSKVEISIRLPNLPAVSNFPGDFRSIDEIERQSKIVF